MRQFWDFRNKYVLWIESGKFYGNNFSIWHHNNNYIETNLYGWFLCFLVYNVYLQKSFTDCGLCIILVHTSENSGNGHKRGQALFVTQWEQPQQCLVCRVGPVGSVLKDTVICGYIQRPADMVKPFNAWGAAPTFQILLEGNRMVKQLRTLSLCELSFLPRFLKGGAEYTGITN